MLCFFLHRAPEAIKESTLEAIGFAATYNNGFRAFLKRHVQLFVNVDTFIEGPMNIPVGVLALHLIKCYH